MNSFRYFKRISDFQPLGKPIGPEGINHWNNIEPIKIQNISKTDSTISDIIITSEYSKNNSQITYPITIGTPSEYLTNITSAFNNSIWWTKNNTEITSKSGKVIESSGEIDDEITSEYYLPALWFEVEVAKDNNNVPVDAYGNSVSKYHNRRLNAFNMICDPEHFGETIEDGVEPYDKHTVTTIFNSSFISASEIYAKTITSKYVELNSQTITNITSEYFETTNTITTTSAYTSAISAGILKVDVPYLYGTNLYFPNTIITNENFSGVSKIYSTSGTFKYLNISSIKSKVFSGSLDHDPTYTNFGVEVSATMSNYFSSIACYFRAASGNDIVPGDLVRLGGSAEIEKTSGSSMTNVLGVVIPEPSPGSTTKSGILLNKKLRTDNPESSDIKLVHIFGYVNKAKIYGPEGIHNMKDKYHAVNNPNGKHHRLITSGTGEYDWRISGCCNDSTETYPCQYDVGPGASLYLCKQSAGAGAFCTKTEDAVNDSSAKQIGIVMEPTDNGSNIEKDFIEFPSPIPEAAKAKGGRRAAVFFISRI